MFKNRWWIVVASFLALIFGQGAVEVFVTGIFIKPISETLHIGRGVISSAMGLTNILTAVALIFLGPLMDRIGVRRVLLPCLVLFALATGSLSFLTPSIALLFLLFGIQGFVGAGQTPTAYSKMITAVFDDHRGLALGIAMAGVGAGVVLLPQYSRYLLAHYGWRGGFVGICVGILVIGFLPVALWFRESDEVKAARKQKISAAKLENLPGVEYSEALKSFRFWGLCIAFFCAQTAINGTMIHAVPMLTDRGIKIGVAVAAMSASGLALIIARIVAGYLLDRIYAAYIVIFFLLCPMVGIAILGLRVGGSGALIGVSLLGLGVGAEIDLVAYILSRYFGVRAFGALHGTAFCFVLVANAAGEMIMGWSYQLQHSYSTGLIIMEVLLLIAMIIQASQGPYIYPAIKPGKGPRDLAAAH
ncbi:MAG: MFS transporter [Candidatus Korobacteraceae bacterium]|jgi:MFS family permease